jgi:uncharacterized membrane protein YozB (DUF420 family)
MAAPSTPPRWIWALICVAFVTLALLSHFAVDPLGAWLQRVHAPVYADIAMDLAAVAAVAAVCAGVFLWRYGATRTLQRSLATAFTSLFALWLILSFVLLGVRFQWAPVVWGIAPYSAAELMFGSLFVCGAVFLAAKAVDLPVVRRSAVAGEI